MMVFSRKNAYLIGTNRLDFGEYLCFVSGSQIIFQTFFTDVTVGDRAFPVAAARTCNSLRQRVTSAPSMSVFRGCLKAFLFKRSFP